MGQEWIEVRISAPVDGAELLSLLGDPGVTGAWEEDGVVRLYWPADRWSGDRLAELKRTLHRLAPAASGPVTVGTLPAEDWNERWARSVKPLRIGSRLVVRPRWEAATLRPGEIEIILDPRQAFGTGHHATTRMLLEWLEQGVRGGESVLDAGTGSGILAMVALKLGAKSALGLDHDPVAIACAKDYAALNGFGDELELRVAALDDPTNGEGRGYDLVLANLDRGTILNSVKTFERHLRSGSRLLLSGLLAEDRAEVAAAFASVGGLVRKSREQEGWLALELIAPESCEGGDSREGTS
ncbi:MAG: 50S ribosomal protein L11 methyltransferase [Nitrospirota bacterium]